MPPSTPDAANADTPAPGGPLLQVVAVLLSPVPDGSAARRKSSLLLPSPLLLLASPRPRSPPHLRTTVYDSIGLAVPLVFTFLLVPPIVRRLYFFPSSIAGTVDKVVTPRGHAEREVLHVHGHQAYDPRVTALINLI